MSRYLTFFLYVTLAMLILGPALAPGYVFLLDMPWPAEFQLSDYTQNGIQPQFPLHVLMTVVNTVLPAWILQKLVLLSVIAGAGSSVYVLARHMFKKTFAVYAGVLAMLNPFVFERLAAGQWLVLAGYAYTPFVIYAYMRWGLRRQFWIAFALLPILSIHFFVMTLVLGTLTLVNFNRTALKQLLMSSGLYLYFLALNAFWIMTLASGNNKSVTLLRSSDFEAFATLSDKTIGVLGNVVNLYGFWRPSSTLKGDNGLWFVYGEVIFLLAVYGLYIGAKSKKLRTWARASGFLLIVCIILSIGFGHSLTRTLIEPATHIPGATVLRETAKLVGIIGIIYALWASYGIYGLAKRLQRNYLGNVAAAVTIVMMSGMLFGLQGKLASHSYPSGWRAANERISRDSKALMLPWQGYLEIQFADNTFMANPAHTFFKFDVLQSKSTGNSLLDNRDDYIKSVLDQYVLGATTYSEFVATMQESNNVTHIVLLKTGNWNKYEELLRENIVFEDQSIRVIKPKK